MTTQSVKQRRLLEADLHGAFDREILLTGVLPFQAELWFSLISAGVNATIVVTALMNYRDRYQGLDAHAISSKLFIEG